MKKENEEKILRQIPNMLTIIRILLTPVLLVFINFAYEDSALRWVAVLFFVALIFTDFIDGKIARKYNYITDFGKLADPIADKIILCALLIFLATKSDWFSCVMIIIIVLREVLVTAVRFVAVHKQNKVIAAEMSGKVKTFSQSIFLAICISPLETRFVWVAMFEKILLIYLVVITLYSGYEFFKNLRNSETKDTESGK